MSFLLVFDSYVCLGDTITCEVDGYTITARIDPYRLTLMRAYLGARSSRLYRV